VGLLAKYDPTICKSCPLDTAVGNHELFDLFVPFEYRFQMPYESSNSDGQNLYWSFDYSIVHVIALNSEHFEFFHWQSQYIWLQRDLFGVNRTETPWVIVSWHCPWYCSNWWHYGSGELMREQYEKLFYDMKVDLVLNGHVHAYERSTNVYNNIITKDGTTYITNGIGGCGEGLVDDWYVEPNWSVFRNGEFHGFGTIDIYNSSVLEWKIISTPDNIVRDSFVLEREH